LFNQIIIQPAQDSKEFDEQILADLISQGYSGEELLAKFKEYRHKVRPAVECLNDSTLLKEDDKEKSFQEFDAMFEE